MMPTVSRTLPCDGTGGALIVGLVVHGGGVGGLVVAPSERTAEHSVSPADAVTRMGVRQLSRSTEAERAGRGWVFARVARRPEDADVGPNVPPSFEPGAAGPRSRAADAPGLYARLRR